MFLLSRHQDVQGGVRPRRSARARAVPGKARRGRVRTPRIVAALLAAALPVVMPWYFAQAEVEVCYPRFPIEIELVENEFPNGVRVNLVWRPESSALTGPFSLVVRDANDDVVASKSISALSTSVALVGVRGLVMVHGLQYRVTVEDDFGAPLSEVYPYFLAASPLGQGCEYVVPEAVKADVLLLSEELDLYLDEDPFYVNLEAALTDLSPAYPQLACEAEGLLAHLQNLTGAPPPGPVDNPADLTKGHSGRGFLWQAVIRKSPHQDSSSAIEPVSHVECEPGFTEYAEQTGDIHKIAAQAVGDPLTATSYELLNRQLAGRVEVEVKLRRWQAAPGTLPDSAAEVVFTAHQKMSVEAVAEVLGAGGGAWATAFSGGMFTVNEAAVRDIGIGAPVSTGSVRRDSETQTYDRTTVAHPVPQPASARLDLWSLASVQAEGDAWAFVEIFNEDYRFEVEASAEGLDHPTARLDFHSFRAYLDVTHLKRWRE